MDAIDVKILGILEKNARISVSDISGQVSLSLSAVSERLKKLEASKVIKEYATILDSDLLGKGLSVIMNISLVNPQVTSKFMDIVDKEREILECHYITGEYDYALKITTESTKALENIMNKIKSIEGINKTQTNVILSTIKNLYSVSPDLNK
ncbi:MAG: Lrp/AsnC family transcriptional regulator [Peptostreptococcaceae bacterium]|nr:Lrp/AsnC family transcriptional regulator [Peptostreptococcaceae bacterium]